MTSPPLAADGEPMPDSFEEVLHGLEVILGDWDERGRSETERLNEAYRLATWAVANISAFRYAQRLKVATLEAERDELKGRIGCDMIICPYEERAKAAEAEISEAMRVIFTRDGTQLPIPNERGLVEHVRELVAAESSLTSARLAREEADARCVRLSEALRHMDGNLTNTPYSQITDDKVINGAWAVFRQLDDDRQAAEAEARTLRAALTHAYADLKAGVYRAETRRLVKAALTSPAGEEQ